MTMPTDLLTKQIRELILEAAPERKNDIEKLWDSHSPQFVHASDRPGFNIEGGAFGLIPFTPRTMGQIWLLGFASWKAFQAYSPYLVFCNEIVPATMPSVPGQIEADKTLSDVLAKVDELRAIGDVDLFHWPAGILHPSDKPKTQDDRAVVDLAKFAATYAFLHEVRHLIFRNEGNQPENPRDEELECDRFARNMLLEEISEYSRMTGYPQDRVLNKRLAGIALGIYVLLHITKNWKGSETHPSLPQRLRALIDDRGASKRRGAWDYACCLLLSVLRQNNRLPARVAFSDPRDLFEKLVRVFET